MRKPLDLWFLCIIALESALMITIQFEALAYPIVDELPMPDFDHEPPAPKKIDRKKVWGSRYVRGLHPLNWNRSKGWKGLHPGKTTFAQACVVLGQPTFCLRWEKTNWGWRDYTFEHGVKIGTAGILPPIRTLDVYPCGEYMADVPLTEHDAKIMYGPIEKRMEMDGCEITTHLKRPGLTIDIFPENGGGRVTCLHFLDPRPTVVP